MADSSSKVTVSSGQRTFALSRSEIDHLLANYVAVREGLSGRLDATVEFRHGETMHVEWVEVSLAVLGPLEKEGPREQILDVLGDDR